MPPRRRGGRVAARLPAWLTLLLFVAVVASGVWLAAAGRLAPDAVTPGSAPGASAADTPTLAPASSMTASPRTSPTPSRAHSTPTPAPSPSEGDPATVLRVIDGDTIDVERAGERVRVRLLNIDTPETKAPGQPVECLGPQASAFTARLLPAGTRVTLRYDRAHYDRYGRTLAGVFVGQRLINREIAAAGLGAPVTFGSNRRFRPEVDAGYAEAKQAHRGFFDAAAHCPAPTQG